MMFGPNLDMTARFAADLELIVGSSHRIKGCSHKIDIKNIMYRNTVTLYL